ncbi:MAG: hypothetical protein PHI31_13355 [Desulfuromonadaceae bacterium]|nr:hypothetical protein [Desulfuromonadaceae bacterium]
MRIPLFLIMELTLEHKKSVLYNLIFISFVILGIYYPCIFNPFNSIDDLKMINGLLNLDDFSLKQLFLPSGSGQYYRPLLYLTFIGDKYIWGLEASFMHFENVLLHLGNSLIVYWLTWQVISTSSEFRQYSQAPLATALLFGLHPIVTEPVNWVSGRTDLLAGFFVFLSFGLFVEAVKQFSYSPHSFESCSDEGRVSLCSKKIVMISSSTLFKYVVGLLGALSMLAGCLSKETALFLVPIILVWCVLPPHSHGVDILPQFLMRRLYLFAIYLTAGGAYLALRSLALSRGDKIISTVVIKVGNNANTEASVEIFDIIRVALKCAGFYFKKLIIPLPLNFGINGISPNYFWLGLLVFFSMVWCLYNRDTISYLFLAAFMLTSPAFILPILKITWTPIAERYIYMASAPFLIGSSLLYLKYITEKLTSKISVLLISVVLGIAAVVTVQRNIVWQDNFTLFADTVKKSPDFGAIKNEYAIALRARGSIDEADNIVRLNVVDEFQPSSLNKIKIMVNNGDLDEARLLLLNRLDKPCDYRQLLYELLLKIDEKRREKSTAAEECKKIDRDILQDLEELVSITGDPFYYYRVGVVQLRLADKKSAKESFKKAYQNSSRNSHYHEAAKTIFDKL